MRGIRLALATLTMGACVPSDAGDLSGTLQFESIESTAHWSWETDLAGVDLTLQATGDLNGDDARDLVLVSSGTVLVFLATQKLAALVPPKGKNLIRFHGVLAPGSRLRALLVPGQRRRERGTATKLIPRTRIPWADLLKRVFSIEILRCVRCGGWREVIGVVNDPLAARKILEHLGLDAEDYEPLPARAPPQLDLAL